MTSMLASFAWRKAHFEPHGPPSNNDHDLDFSSPGVSASSSGDTMNSMVDPHMPLTPEGLRTRKTAASIREELGLPRGQLDWLPQRTAQLVNSSSQVRSMLPPILPSNSMASPQVSTSSFYTRSSHSTHNVAKSPSLVVGQAKTAVGALLAMSETPNSFHGTESSMLSSGSILPSREWAGTQNAAVGNARAPFNDTNSHYSSMASQSILPTPPQSDDESFSHASPSSNYYRNKAGSRHGAAKLETSFSRSFMMDQSRELYNIPNMEGNDLYVPKNTGPSHDLNVSGISQSTKDIESLHSLGGDLPDEDLFSHDDDMIGSDRQDMQSLSFSKIQGQRFDRDDLLFSTMERLQDDSRLVLEVLDGPKHTSLLRSTTKRLAEQNFFNGFSMQNRDTICNFIDEIVKEKPSMFQRISERKDDFEQALAFASALLHTAVPASEKTMKLQSSVTGFPQQGRWKCVPGFRASIGLLEEPKSPATLRGGDTSLFSLPSQSATDATPHTSNVSVTTTITSAFSPEKHGFHFQQKNLRQTTETIVSLFDRLGAACTKLMGENFSSSNVSIMAAEEITRVYLQLQTISVGNLEALVDSFELDVLSLPIPRLISDDQGENMDTSDKPTTIVPVPEMKPPAEESSNSAQQLLSQTMALSTALVEEKEDRGEGNSVFSPCTTDMMSVEVSTNVTEDLRRAVGSFDEADVREERDAPPTSFVAEQRPLINNAAKKKSRRTKLWKRILVPRKKSAE